ncbi:MAG TPA: RES family NAD+ phosphorylase [bacterium]|nr:RES family NAD+ phosphorylase [bacterium]
MTMIEGSAWRVYPGGRDPMHFNKRDGRFNDPRTQYGVGVLYASQTDVGAFVERLLLAPGPLGGEGAAGAGVPVSATALRNFALAAVTFTRPITCVDLRTSNGLRQIGAGASLLSAPHAISQQWSRPIFLHPSAPEGIVWNSRVGEDIVSLGIHERAKPKIAARSLGALIGHRRLLAEVIRRFGAVIVPA